jgi:hypothetical protein
MLTFSEECFTITPLKETSNTHCKEVPMKCYRVSYIVYRSGVWDRESLETYAHGKTELAAAFSRYADVHIDEVKGE